MTSNEDRRLFEAIAEAGRAGRRCALATVIETRGSTPRKVGTKMLVDPEVGLVGTIGGGCGEGEVLEAAARVLSDGGSRTVEVDLTEDLMSWSPAVCGGTMRVLLEVVEPGTA